jgi:hypothetical protein
MTENKMFQPSAVRHQEESAENKFKIIDYEKSMKNLHMLTCIRQK